MSLQVEAVEAVVIKPVIYHITPMQELEHMVVEMVVVVLSIYQVLHLPGMENMDLLPLQTLAEVVVEVLQEIKVHMTPIITEVMEVLV